MAADIEFYSWPPNKIDGRSHYGCIAIDKHTGAAVLVDNQRGMRRNQRLAEERLRELLAVLPWGEK